ncbi:MAG: hypothetical protein KF821_01760 [Anaerolineales bacterium]|jgi:hypothetical protein|nr:hypothetical protein [Anaerolineales bacterium]
MATEFSPAPNEAVGLVERLAEKHGLDELRIGVLMRDEAAVVKGREVWAKAYKPPAWAPAFGLDYDLLVELAANKWNVLDRHQREALVDFALCHVQADYDEKKGITVYKMVAPDIQAFSSNLQEYGLWYPTAHLGSSTFEDARQVQMPGVARKGKVESVKEEFTAGMGRIGLDDVNFETTEGGLVISASKGDA